MFTLTTVLSFAISQATVLAPEDVPGRKVQTQIRVSQEYLMGSYVEQIGDQARSQGAAGTISTNMFVSFEDDYREGGEVVRRFEEVGFGSKSVMTTPKGKPRTESLKFVSLFESFEILFTWIAAENDYARRYLLVGSSEEPLKRLRFDADGRSILPVEAVDVGAIWSVDGAQLARLLTPAGDLGLRPEKRWILGRSIKLGVGAQLAELFDASSLGQATCEFTERRTADDGSELAVIRVKDLTLQAIVDATNEYDRLMPREERREAAVLDGAIIDVSLLGGTGTLIWNVTRSRIQSLDLQAEQRLIMTVQKQFAGGEEPVTRIQSVTYDGLLKLGLTAVEST